MLVPVRLLLIEFPFVSFAAQLSGVFDCYPSYRSPPHCYSPPQILFLATFLLKCLYFINIYIQLRHRQQVMNSKLGEKWRTLWLEFGFSPSCPSPSWFSASFGAEISSEMGRCGQSYGCCDFIFCNPNSPDTCYNPVGGNRINEEYRHTHHFSELEIQQ